MPKGDIRVKFFAGTNLAPRDMGTQGYLRATDASGKFYVNTVGNGRVTIPISELAQLDGAYSFIQVFDVCVVYLINDTDTERIAQFIVRDVKLGSATTPGKPSFFVLSGPDMLHGLGRTINGVNIGKKYEGELAATDYPGYGRNYVWVKHGNLEDEGHTYAEAQPGAGDPDEWPVFWPKWTLIKATSSDNDASFVEIPQAWEDSKSADKKWAAGDLINISWQFTTPQCSRSSISSITGPVDSKYTINLTDNLTHSARRQESGGTRYYPLWQPHIFKGDPVRIEQDDATWHETRVRREAEHDWVGIEEPLTTTVSAGNKIEWWSHRELNTLNDIEEIMKPAVLFGWAQTGLVSSGGSRHLVDANSTLSLLEATAKSTGDYFYARQASASLPERHLVWRQSSPSTGLTLKTITAQGDASTAISSATDCLIHSISRDTKDFPLSAVVPVAGPDFSDVGNLWNLRWCDETPAAGLLRLYGITTSLTLSREYVNGHYRITNDNATLQSEERIDYPDIEPASETHASRVDAANRLQAAAALTLHNRQTYRNEYIVTTVLPDGVEINQGESIILDHTDSEWDVDNETVYIAEMEHSVRNTGKLKGVRVTKLTLSTDGPYVRDTGATIVAGAIRDGLSPSRSVGGTGGGLADDPSDDPAATNHEPVTIASTTADWLTIDGQELTLDVSLSTNSGLQITANELEMGTPTYVGSVTTSQVSGAGHTHAVLNTDDAENNSYILLRSDANGRLRMSGAGIKTSADADGILLGSSADIEGASFSSGFLGNQFGIDTSQGHGDFRSLYADELRITLLSANESQVINGSWLISPGMGKTSRDFTIPAVSSSGTIYFHDSEALPDAAIFRDGSAAMLQVRDDTGEGLTLANVWGTLTNYSDEASGEQSWTWTTNSVGASFVGDTVPAEGVCLGLGHSGDGFAEIAANDAYGSPYFRIATWIDNPYTAGNRTENVRLGNLNGISGLDEEWGLYVGLDPAGPRAVMSNQRFGLHDVDLTMYAGTPDTNAAIRMKFFELNSDVTTAIAPDGDVSSSGVTRSTGAGTYWSHVDTVGTDYLYNTDSDGGNAVFTLESIDDALTELSIEVNCATVNRSTDFLSLWAQVFKSDGVTALTNKVRVFAHNMTDGVNTAYFSDLDTTATQVEWNAAVVKFTWLYNVASGSGDEFLTIDNTNGLVLEAETAYNYETNLGYTFEAVGYDVGGLWGSLIGGNTAVSLVAKDGSGSADTRVNLSSIGGTSADGSIFLYAAANNDLGTNASILIDTADAEITINATDVEISNDVLITSGLTVGASASASPGGGQIIMDRLTGDGLALAMRSTGDVSGMTTQAMENTATFFQIEKYNATNGGVVLRAGGETSEAMWIAASVNTPGAAYAPIVISSANDGAGMATTDNLVIFKNYLTDKVVIKGDGDLWVDGTYETFDHLDSDVEMVRASSLLSGNAIKTSFDDNIRYNQEHLESAGLIETRDDGYLVNTTGMMRLHSGALWQLHQRITELENLLAQTRNRPSA